MVGENIDSEIPSPIISIDNEGLGRKPGFVIWQPPPPKKGQKVEEMVQKEEI